jgi:hypothetical protein
MEIPPFKTRRYASEKDREKLNSMFKKK